MKRGSRWEPLFLSETYESDNRGFLLEGCCEFAACLNCLTNLIAEVGVTGFENILFAGSRKLFPQPVIGSDTGGKL